MKSMEKVQHVQGLDAVRAIAIVGVLLVHAGTPGFQAGWLGVDLFFALSGFLITTLLLSEHERSGDISYRRFLMRRFLRLVPAYLLYVVVVTYGIWGWSGSVRTETDGWTATGYTIALWTYVNNFAPLGGIWNGQVVTLHLWSLAVEQQYYLIWPLMVIGLAKRPKALLAAAAVLSLAAVVTFALTPDSLYKASLLPTRGFTLVLASTAAIAAMQYRHLIPQLPWKLIHIVGGALVLIAFGLSAADVWSENQVRDRLLPALSTVFVLWIVRLWYLPLPPRTAPFLLNPAIRYVGEISYGIYLYHQLIRIAIWYYGKPIMADWPSSLGYITRLLLYIGVSIAVATLSYELFEKRFLKMRGRFRV